MTGANQPFARTLWQFLRSAERAGLQSTYRWMVYDLGLGLAARDMLTRSFPWISVRNFDFAAYPPHVAMKSRSYAWKPIIMAEVLDEFQAPSLWLDSATIVTSDLSEPFAIMAKHGIVSLKGKPQLGEHCDPRVLKELGVAVELLHLPERVAGVVGFDPAHKVARELAGNWARHALVENRILPPDAIPNHKPEQAILSALLYKAEAQGLITLNQDEVDISSGRPMRWLTTRNKVWAWLPRIADPICRLYYWLYKAGDQFNHRFWDWEKRLIGGAERRYREHYEVSLQRGDGAPVVIASPDGGYYADPFPLEVKGKSYLLVEDYRYMIGRGKLTCLALDESLKPVDAMPILPRESHLSFPFVFSFGGSTYLVPETHEARSVDLFAMGDNPAEWSLSRRLLYGLDAVDTVIVQHLGHWWLITSVLEPGAQNRHLEIYFAKDLLHGEFKPHPVNAERRYQQAKHGTGRNAGTYLRTASGFVRPMQNSIHHYGEGVQLMRIVRLDPEGFEETAATETNVYSDVVDALSPHHVAQGGGMLCWDVRDRAR